MYSICFLNALASIASKLFSTKYLMVFVSYSPLIEVIVCFNLTTPSDPVLLIFLRPSISLSIVFSSFCVNNLNVTFTFDDGKTKSNSFFPSLSKSSFNYLSET